MCGRYQRRGDKQRIAEAFRLGRVPEGFELPPDYNVAPQTFQPVIRLDAEGERELAMMRWGLIPYWAKDAKVGYSTINARAETVASAPIFREAFQRRHCLVPADAFYEWQRLDEKGKKKQAYAIARRDGEMMAFAGLWESWRDPATKQPLETFSVITTEPNELMQPIHSRMPVILPRGDWSRWLERVDPARPPVDLLRPHAAEEMTAWRVKKDVGDVRNNRPDLAEPDEPCEPCAGATGSLFD
jgi:putative SOS response-associated peptidase YedK